MSGDIKTWVVKAGTLTASFDNKIMAQLWFQFCCEYFAGLFPDSKTWYRFVRIEHER